MSNEQVIKSAHVWAFVVAVLFGVIVFAGRAESTASNMALQNANSNTNTSRNKNSNKNANKNANTTSASNANTSNASNSNAAGEQTGMTAMSADDREFIMDAAIGGMMEVQLGRWAVQKGTSDAVKQFGQRMVDDHSKANEQLMQLASSKGITLPTALDEKHQKDMSKVTRLSGAEFDKAYSKMMLSDHNKDVKEFEKQSTRAADADLKAFATTTLPTLREHLEMAKALPGNEGRGNTMNSNTGTGTSNNNSNSKSNSNSNSNRNRNRNSNGNSNNSNQP